MFHYPNIGLNSAQDHLNEIMFPAYSRFRQRQTCANALEVAQAAWQIHERLWHDQGRVPEKKKFRDDLFAACPELKLLRDWVETAKHTGLGRQDVELVSITGAEWPGGVLETSTPFGNSIIVPECTLTMNVGDKHYPVTDVLRCVVEFWKQKLQ
jgi:hypothetical protein